MKHTAKSNNQAGDIPKSPDEQFTSEISALLLKQIPDDMKLIESMYEIKDWEKLTFHVHKLHGALCYTHFTQAKTTAMMLEKALREKRPKLNKIDECYQVFHAEIRALMNAGNSE
jgi:HPt (histidine-containing phosphotransfer) domain-containing protein